MRHFTISFWTGARAVFAAAFVAAALFAGTALASDDPSSLEIANLTPGIAAIPHVEPLPRILSEQDISRYQLVFELQERGDLEAAAAVIIEIDNPILLGHVQAQKYLHPTAHRSRFKELKLWLSEYADHPDAPRIYKLAMRRKPANALRPRRSRVDSFGTVLVPADRAISPPKAPGRGLGKSNRQRLAGLQRDMRSRLSRGWPTGAREVLNGKAHRGLASAEQYDTYRARIAWSYYLYNKDELAFELASASAERSRRYLPSADWTAALAAWRLGRLESARHHFEAIAESAVAERWMVSGAAFWASRVHLRLGHPEAASRWLRIAAEEPRSLYGLLANRALGAIPEFYWEPQALTNNDLDVVLAVPAVVRAIALYEVGQTARASKEVLRIQYRATPEIARALLALATALQLPALETSLGGRLGAIDGRRHDFAVYPVPGWVPDNGFTVDPALIYALIRQESRFKETAKSRRGARGVMQVMPSTARFAARSAGLGRISRDALMIPETNIAIGQAYVGHLLEHDLAGQNLLFTLASYNAGPGNLGKWLPNTNFGEDPLLFMESTRSRETRHFMRVVLTNYWIYRLRLGEQTPSLDQMAGGTWPTYSGPRH